MNPSLSALLKNQPVLDTPLDVFRFAHDLVSMSNTEAAKALLADHMMKDFEQTYMQPLNTTSKKPEEECRSLLRVMGETYQDAAFAEAKYFVEELKNIHIDGERQILILAFSLYSRRCLITLKPNQLEVILTRMKAPKFLKPMFEQALKIPVKQTV